MEELDELRKRNIQLQNERDRKLTKLLEDKNNQLEMLKLETEMLEEELKDLIKVKSELQTEIDRLNLNYNLEKSNNQETLNVLAKIKLENVVEVLKLKKQIEELEDERYQLLINKIADPETDSTLEDVHVGNLSTSISELEESAQEISREAMVNCTLDPDDELWDLYYSRLIAERKLELSELQCRFNNTKSYIEIHQDMIQNHKSSCRVETEKNESSGSWTKRHKEWLLHIEAIETEQDRFGYSPDFYESIKKGYVPDNFFTDEINKFHMMPAHRNKFITREYEIEYENIRVLTKGRIANRVHELYEAFLLIEFRRSKNGKQPCNCRQTDSILPCDLHANLFRSLTIARLSGNTTLIQKKRKLNYCQKDKTDFDSWFRLQLQKISQADELPLDSD